jgi:gluconolactonase
VIASTVAIWSSLGGFVTVVLVLGGLSDTYVSQTGQHQPGIPGVISGGTQARLIKDGFHGLEGRMPAPEGGLYFSEVNENRTYYLGPNGSIRVWRDNTNRTNGLYLLKSGILLCAEGDGPRIIGISPAKAITVLASSYRGQALRQPNDLIPDRKGGIYFTDPAPRPAPNLAPMQPGNVYYIRRGGELLLLDDAIRRPNGITLSLDQKTLYVDDTEGEFVYAFDVQSGGSVRNKRPFVKLHEPEQGSLGLRSRADGMALDSADRLYVATTAGIQVIDEEWRLSGNDPAPCRGKESCFQVGRTGIRFT